MSAEYTPTTSEARHLYARAAQTELDQTYARAGAEFDRWLAAHDAKVLAAGITEGIRKARDGARGKIAAVLADDLEEEPLWSRHVITNNILDALGANL